MIDVYVYGMISPSLVHVLRQDFSFPKANGYAEIERTLPSIGGEAANSAIALARLGLSVKLDGNWLNVAAADRVAGTLARYGIDVSRLSRTEYLGTDEVVIADGESRTVFGNYAAFHSGPRQWNEPRPEDVVAASVVCLDPYFRDESRLAAELCVEHGKPYVTLDSRHQDFVARHAAIVAVSHELRDQAYAGRDLRQVFGDYLAACEGLVIFTFGGGELWYGRRGGSLTTRQPYRIEPIDTTGAGDAFRGALAYGLLKGWPDEQTIDFASAVAACVCLTMPHALDAPSLEEVTAFMERYGSAPNGRD
jgi:sugar/nucleoside kinase (ribokinase family)